MSLFVKLEDEYYIEGPKNHIAFIGCKKCGYSKYHIDLQDINQIEEFKNVNYSEHHFTCLCDLFESSIICCSKGYQNLLFTLPFIAINSPIPFYTTENLFYNGRNEFSISISGTEYTNLNYEW